MTIAKVQQTLKAKPWGVVDLTPWANASNASDRIGEIWYEPPSHVTKPSALQLKLLFTSRPLSIQVHPDDALAKSIGLPRGKTEAWYVLDAAPDAQVALGLQQATTTQDLRSAVHAGTIVNLMAWKPAASGDSFFVPAGTIHAIGAGLVIAEIQQRSEATFRLFDHGSDRELHIEDGLCAASTTSVAARTLHHPLTTERHVLVSCPYFVFERIELPGGSSWALNAQTETWCLILCGDGDIAAIGVAQGDCVFVDREYANIRTGTNGITLLIAYAQARPDVKRLVRNQQRAIPSEAQSSLAADARKSNKLATTVAIRNVEGVTP